LSRKRIVQFSIAGLLGLAIIYLIFSQGFEQDKQPYVTLVDRDEFGQEIPIRSEFEELEPPASPDQVSSSPRHISEEEFSKTVRFELANTDEMPDGMAFTASLMSLSILSEEDPSFIVAALMSGMGLTKSESETLGPQLVALQEEFEDEKRRRRLDLLCANGVPRVYGDDVYTVFERMDDITDNYSEELFLSFYGSQPTEIKDRIRKWTNDAKRRTTVIRFNFKKHYEQTGGSADAVASRLCLRSTSYLEEKLDEQ
jgi:hypothetical protein